MVNSVIAFSIWNYECARQLHIVMMIFDVIVTSSTQWDVLIWWIIIFSNTLKVFIWWFIIFSITLKNNFQQVIKQVLYEAATAFDKLMANSKDLYQPFEWKNQILVTFQIIWKCVMSHVSRNRTLLMFGIWEYKFHRKEHLKGSNTTNLLLHLSLKLNLNLASKLCKHFDL